MSNGSPNFEQEYRSFLAIVSSLLTLQIETIENTNLRILAIEFKGNVISPLSIDLAVNSVVAAVRKESDLVQLALTDELRFYNAQYGYLVELSRISNPNELNRASEKAEVVKGSIERVLNLPPWIANLLKILNELLSLLRP